MRLLVWVFALGMMVAVPAEAGTPFTFGWGTTGRAAVKEATDRGGVKVRREYELELTAGDDGYWLDRVKERVVSVEGALSIGQVRAVDAHLRPLNRPIHIDRRGVATAVEALDEGVREELKRTVPEDAAIRWQVHREVKSQAAVEARDEAAVHEWNALVGYWTGRDRNMSEPVRARLPDGRVMVMEHLGPVSEPAGWRHLSVTVTGPRAGTVRGCSKEFLAAAEISLQGDGASEAEVEHVLKGVTCALTEATEAVVDPDTLRPSLVVRQDTMVTTYPGREAVEEKATVRRDFVWKEAAPSK